MKSRCSSNVCVQLIGHRLPPAGACIDNTLLSAQGVLSYSKLPSVTVVQGELVSGLAMLTSNTAAVLQRHPAHLSALLQQYIRQQTTEEAA